MKIRGVTTAVVEANYEYTFVKIETDTHLRGYGECFFAPGLAGIIRELRPLLVGEDARDIDRLVRKMVTAGCGTSSGALFNAISGIEIALCDVLGQSLRVPVYQLLGGKYRTRIRVYADCHAGEGLESLSSVLIPRKPSWAGQDSRQAEVHPKYHGGRAAEAGSITPEAYARRARQVQELGFTALKFDVDVPNPYSFDDYNRSLSNREIEFMVSLVAAVRSAVGPEMDVAIDCHWNFNVSDVLRLAWACEPYELLWLEDPTPPENVDALAQVTRSTRIPICTGENHVRRFQFRELLEKGAVRILAPDVQKAGGLFEGRRIADLADMHYVALAPHNISSPIGTLASAHLCAAIPNFLLLEFHSLTVPFWGELAVGHDGPIIDRGYITLSERPGLGISLNEDVAYRYRKPSEPFFEE